jgi:hypothetical protein
MKPIPNYPNYSVTKDGKVWTHIYDKWMKLNKGKVGYYTVGLWHNMKHKKMYIHRLVAMTYLENNNNLACVNHIDGDKLNNNITNLEWCSASDNNRHAHKLGLNYISQSNRVEASRTAKEKFSKIVLDTQTGIFYNSARDAAMAKGINSNTLHTKLNGNAKNNTSLIYA